MLYLIHHLSYLHCKEMSRPIPKFNIQKASIAMMFALLCFIPFAFAATTHNLSLFVEFTGESTNSNYAGRTVAPAGDVNGDGYKDFLIGAYGNNDGGANTGAVYLIYGSATPFTSRNLTNDIKFWGEAVGDLVGETSIASAGDVNGDGYDDILIGAYRNDDAGADAGAAYLIYGQAATLTSASLSTAIEFTGEVAGDKAGYFVASAGDVNFDTYDDFLVGAYMNDDGPGDNGGAAYLIYGQADPLVSASLSTAVEFTGEVAGDNAGTSVSSAGDVNNDTYSDILVGAQSNDDGPGDDGGAAYLIYG